MAYETEKQRVKMSKYRVRKGLRDAGYSEQEIADIVACVNWDVMTPAQVLAEYVEYDDDDTDSERQQSRVSRAANGATENEDTDGEQRPLSTGEKIGLGVMLAGAGVVAGVIIREVVISLAS